MTKQLDGELGSAENSGDQLVTSDDPRASSDREIEFALVQKILAGAREEYRVLVEKYQDMVFGCIMRQVGDYEVTRDLSQDTFIKAYRALATFRGDSRFSTWLLRIALNLCSDYFTSRHYVASKRSTTVDDSEALAVEAPPTGDPVSLKALRSAIAAISPKLRSVLVLCGLEGRSYEEAAEVLAVPVGTVRSRLNQARANLLAIITEDEHE